jgi:hypothetical protein
MPKKKTTTEKGTPELRIELVRRGDRDDLPEDFHTWEMDGLIYSEMLGSRECPAAFRRAFESLFLSHLMHKVDTTKPYNISAFYPLVMLCLRDNAPCEAAAIADALRTLREELAGDLTEKILAEMDDDSVKGDARK